MACLLESRNKTVKLSNDQEIILGLAEVIVVTGIKESKFLHRRIGPINLARFTTSQARVLRCYMSEILRSIELESAHVPTWPRGQKRVQMEIAVDSKCV